MGPSTRKYYDRSIRIEELEKELGYSPYDLPYLTLDKRLAYLETIARKRLQKNNNRAATARKAWAPTTHVRYTEKPASIPHKKDVAKEPLKKREEDAATTHATPVLVPDTTTEKMQDVQAITSIEIPEIPVAPEGESDSLEGMVDDDTGPVVNTVLAPGDGLGEATEPTDELGQSEDLPDSEMESEPTALLNLVERESIAELDQASGDEDSNIGDSDSSDDESNFSESEEAYPEVESMDESPDGPPTPAPDDNEGATVGEGTNNDPQIPGEFPLNDIILPCEGVGCDNDILADINLNLTVNLELSLCWVCTATQMQTINYSLNSEENGDSDMNEADDEMNASAPEAAMGGSTDIAPRIGDDDPDDTDMDDSPAQAQDDISMQPETSETQTTQPDYEMEDPVQGSEAVPTNAEATDDVATEAENTVPYNGDSEAMEGLRQGYSRSDNAFAAMHNNGGTGAIYNPQMPQKKVHVTQNDMCPTSTYKPLESSLAIDAEELILKWMEHSNAYIQELTYEGDGQGDLQLLPNHLEQDTVNAELEVVRMRMNQINAYVSTGSLGEEIWSFDRASPGLLYKLQAAYDPLQMRLNDLHRVFGKVTDKFASILSEYQAFIFRIRGLSQARPASSTVRPAPPKPVNSSPIGSGAQNYSPPQQPPMAALPGLFLNNVPQHQPQPSAIRPGSSPSNRSTPDTPSTASTPDSGYQTYPARDAITPTPKSGSSIIDKGPKGRSTKRDRSSESTDRSDNDEDREEASPKRIKAESDQNSRTQAKFALNPMHPSRSYFPLKDLNTRQAASLIYKWAKESADYLKGLNYKEDDVIRYTGFEADLRQPAVIAELEYTAQRMAQINQYATNGSKRVKDWNNTRVSRALANKIWGEYKDMEDIMDDIHRCFYEMDGAKWISKAMGEWYTFCALTTDIIDHKEDLK